MRNILKQVIRYYFSLQYKLLYRAISGAGIAPLIVWVLAPVLLVAALEYTYEQTSYAGYLIALVTVSISVRLSESKRNEFLKVTFSNQDYQLIRVIENSLLAFPFFLYLLYKSEFMVSIALLVSVTVLSFWNSKSTFNFVLPTPFKALSIEYVIGFRQSILVYLLPYFFLYFSIREENMNLGIFSLFVQGSIIAAHYTKPESSYLVWNYSYTPAAFLIHKLKTGAINTTLINLPLLLFLGYSFPVNLILLVGIHLTCLLYIFLIILLKYHAFPKEMDLGQGVFFLVTLLFPPILLLAIPYLFKESSIRLNDILK